MDFIGGDEDEIGLRIVMLLVPYVAFTHRYGVSGSGDAEEYSSTVEPLCEMTKEPKMLKASQLFSPRHRSISLKGGERPVRDRSRSVGII